MVSEWRQWLAAKSHFATVARTVQTSPYENTPWSQFPLTDGATLRLLFARTEGGAGVVNRRQAFLSSGQCPLRRLWQKNPSRNRGALSRMGCDVKDAVYHLNSFAHADQSQAATKNRHVFVEAFAFIRHR